MQQSTMNQSESIGSLLRQLTTEICELFSQEVELAKTELGEKASVAARNIGAIAVGGAIMFLGAIALLAATVTGLGALLETFLPDAVAVWLAPLLVGLALALFGYTRVQAGLGNLRREGLVPQETHDAPAEEQAMDPGKEPSTSRAYGGSGSVRARRDETRKAMDQTIDALQDKLTPSQLLRDGLGLLRSGSERGATKLVELARKHPVLAPIIRIGLGMVRLALP